MNLRELGPRNVPYIDADGEEGAGAIHIKFGAPTYIDVDEDEPIERQTGDLEVQLIGRQYTFTTNGADDLQVAFYLMRVAGAWLIRVAEEEGLTLFGDRRTPIKEPMDLFDS
ncbi:MAG: hypothetical protein PSX79_15445 [bacterium]|nr:hypothetical protein [bacterium]